MHILFVIPAYAPFVGGAQTFARAMVRRLVADGHDVTVLTTNARQAADFWRPPSTGAQPEASEMDGAQVVRVPLRPLRPVPYHFGMVRRMGHWLQRSPLPARWQRPILGYLARSMPPLTGLQSILSSHVSWADLIQVIDVNWDGLFTAASDAAHKAHKPLVAVPLIHTGSHYIRAHFLMAHQIAAYEQAAAVVTLSRAEGVLLAKHGVAVKKLHVLPMGVEPGQAAVDPGLSAAFCSWYNLQRPFVAFLGATTLDKGAFTLAEAILRLNQRGVDLDLVCAGPLQSELQRFIATHPPAERDLLQAHVHLLGVVDEPTKQAMLAAAVALALPSRVDSFGIALLEAWQQGKPVVAAAEGGLVETVRHGETGLLVPFGDVTALATALAYLLQHPDVAAQLGQQGQRVVLQRYTWDHTYETLCALYEQIDQSGHTPRTHAPGSPAGIRAIRERDHRLQTMPGDGGEAGRHG